MKLKATLALLVAGMCMAAAQNVFAQAEVNGPTALITTYRAKPGARVKFRSIMQGEGVDQFERWKKAGVFASYQALFTSYAGDSVPDMFLVVRFNHFSDLARWQKVEETFPGGLPVDAQSLASADTSSYGRHREGEPRGAHDQGVAVLCAGIRRSGRHTEVHKATFSGTRYRSSMRGKRPALCRPMLRT